MLDIVGNVCCRHIVADGTVVPSLEAGSWELGAESWELRAGSWELGAGSKLPALGSRPPRGMRDQRMCAPASGSERVIERARWRASERVSQRAHSRTSERATQRAHTTKCSHYIYLHINAHVGAYVSECMHLCMITVCTHIYIYV